MYRGIIDRLSFAGTLFDGYWPEGSEWELSPQFGEDATRWKLRGGVLVEAGGSRVLVAVGNVDRPSLRVTEAPTIPADGITAGESTGR